MNRSGFAWFGTALFLNAAVVASGCVDKGPPKKTIDPAYIQRNVLAAPPPVMTNTVNADFDGTVVYLGNDVVSTAPIAPGAEIHVVHYWKAVAAPGEDWRIFSHAEGNSGDWANVDYTDMRAGYGPDKWKAGDIIRDEQKFALPKNWRSNTVQLSVGLYRKGVHGRDGRMKVTGQLANPENKVAIATFAVQASANVPANETVIIRKTNEPIVIDGIANEPAWNAIAWSEPFKDASGGPKVGYPTKAKLLWDHQFLYAFVDVTDPDVFSEFTQNDDTLWKADVVELFIDADRNRKGYVELQVNPHNAQLDIWFPGGRGQNPDKTWQAGMISAVQVSGTKDNRNDRDTSWTVEIAIPLQAVKGRDLQMDVRIPPEIGDTWGINVVRVEKAQTAKNVTASAWSQIPYSDFHALNSLLAAKFADENGALEPPGIHGANPPGPHSPEQPETGVSAAPTPSVNPPSGLPPAGEQQPATRLAPTALKQPAQLKRIDPPATPEPAPGPQ